jgi:CMP/dCMP kinase
MIVKRDKDDSERAVAPLKKAEDAQVINTTALSLKEVCTVILDCIQKTTR